MILTDCVELMAIGAEEALGKIAVLLVDDELHEETVAIYHFYGFACKKTKMVAHRIVLHLFYTLYVDCVKRTQSLVPLECVDLACKAKGNCEEEMARMDVEGKCTFNQLILRGMDKISCKIDGKLSDQRCCNMICWLIFVDVFD